MAKGARGSGSNQHEVRSHADTAPPLAELGISKTQSSRWQKLADVPEEDFEATSRELTTAYTNGSIVCRLWFRPRVLIHEWGRRINRLRCACRPGAGT
jgi:hypothetical protein